VDSLMIQYKAYSSSAIQGDRWGVWFGKDMTASADNADRTDLRVNFPDGAAARMVRDTTTFAGGLVDSIVMGKPTGGSFLYMPTFFLRNSQAKEIEYWNMASDGMALSTMAKTSTPTGASSYFADIYMPLLFGPAAGADAKNVFFLEAAWVLDKIQGETALQPVTTVIANLRIMIALLKSMGDVVIYTEPSGDTANRRTYIDAIVAEALAQDLPVFDASRVITDYNTTYWYDGGHQNATGTPYPAASLAKRLLNI